MSDQTISLNLAVTLGSLAVHIEEMFESDDPAARTFDESAIQTLLDNEELKEWITKMGALLPVKR